MSDKFSLVYKDPCISMFTKTVVYNDKELPKKEITHK